VSAGRDSAAPLDDTSFPSCIRRVPSRVGTMNEAALRLTRSPGRRSVHEAHPWALAATALVASSLALGAPAAAALAPLPADGSQVNNDPGNSIDRNHDAGVSDVVGGAVTAGKLD
jgi:hypothetical protein